MDPERVIWLAFCFVVGWLIGKFIIAPLIMKAQNSRMRNPFKRGPKPDALIDMTDKLVALGAPELPNSVKYLYDAQKESLHVDYGGGRHGRGVRTYSEDTSVEASFLRAAKGLYRSIEPEVKAEQERQRKLEFAKNQALSVIGERKAWVDDAS